MKMKLVDAVKGHHIMQVPRSVPDGTSPAHTGRGADKWHEFHGERFRSEFDEAFGLLYFDLKIIAGACNNV